MAKYTVAVGTEFVIDGTEIESVEAVERLAAIDDRRRLARQQAQITLGVLSVMALAMATAALVGWADGTYDELSSVWGAGSVWVGLVLGRHFKKD